MKRYSKTELHLLICCFITYTATYISRCNLAPSLDAIASTFHVTTATVGLLPTCFALPYAAGQAVSGWLADRLPAPRMMLIGLLGSAIVNMLFSVCPVFTLLLILCFINGLLQSLIWTPIIRIMAIHFREEVRNHAAFFMSLSLIFGYLLAWALSGFLTSQLHWRVAFLISGIVTAAIGMPAILSMRRLAVQMQTQSHHQEHPDIQAPARHMLLHTNLLLILIACFGNGYVRDGIMNWATKLLMDTQNLDLNSAVGIILIIPAVNYLGIQLGSLVFHIVRNNVYLSCAILFALCTGFCMVLGPATRLGLVPCILVLVFISSMSYGLNPLLTTLLPMIFRPQNRIAFAAGLMDAMVYVGSAFSGFFAGYLSDSFDWNALFFSWALFSLLSTITMVCAWHFIPRRKHIRFPSHQSGES